jgi:hypothetical protein
MTIFTAKVRRCKEAEGTLFSLHLCTFAPLHLCTFAPLHLCTFAPLHLCSLCSKKFHHQVVHYKKSAFSAFICVQLFALESGMSPLQKAI